MDIPTLSDHNIAWIHWLISQEDTHRFYRWAKWLAVRRFVLSRDHHECQHCKKKGRHSKAVIVHHIKHLVDRPDLALSPIDPETGALQLVSLCKACHEAEHPESLPVKHVVRFTNTERF